MTSEQYEKAYLDGERFGRNQANKTKELELARLKRRNQELEILVSNLKTELLVMRGLK